MFTGIVEETGRLEAFARGPQAWRLEVAAPRAAADAALGESIAVNGCCLTVVGTGGGRLQFDILEETRGLTNFSSTPVGGLVNLERSLNFGGPVSGHFVSGHIDALGTVAVLEGRGADHYLRVGLAPEYSRYLVLKGSIAIDGVSLTVAEVGPDERGRLADPTYPRRDGAQGAARGRPGERGIRSPRQIRGETAARPIVLACAPPWLPSPRNLRRLQSAGVKRVAVSDEGLAALKGVLGRRSVPVFAQASVSTKPFVSAQPSPDKSPDEAVRVTAPAAASTSKARVAGPSLPPSPAFVLPEGGKAERWAALREIVRQDPVCRAHVHPGCQVVFGVGDVAARIFFVGEAPGADEEIQGEPFVGAAGQLLNKMIAGMGLARGEVYIGNIMNWRPEMPLGADGKQTGNRPPTADEMAYCLPYLRAQIDIVGPAIVVALGATATQGLLGAGSFRALGEVRGRWHAFAGRPLMVTYHPSYILRNPTNKSKRLIWEDLLLVMARAELPISDRQRGYFLENKS